MVILAGASGKLGNLIALELLKQKAQVRALVRKETNLEKIKILKANGCEVVEVNFSDAKALTKACSGGDVVVSAVAGLRDIIIDMQTQLLEAAAAAEVPRFIPSDFSIDYTKLLANENRNLSYRNEFKERADRSDLKITSVLNGGFMDMLTGTAPFILFNQKKILCWGNPDQLMDWTTIEDTARFTAFAALDSKTPRYLKIAGDQISANKLCSVMSELTKEKYKVFRPGGLGLFKFIIRATKFFSKDTSELYPAWQGMQYMHNMYSEAVKFEKLDNDRYPMKFTTSEELLREFLK